ncbi:MAG TPA: FAD-containing oxidoreductase [Acidobacteriaceae bacterium]|nr:FAD-containing oxidoreductase [Acidobacteriaceae bacterium]
MADLDASFDAIIVGAGQAGPSLAGKLTAAGWTVGFVERQLFGGTCVNVGCTPTKTLIASAKTAYVARRAKDFGVKVTGEVVVDMRATKERKDAIVARSRDGIESWLRGMKGCSVFMGTARFEGLGVMRVGDKLLGAKKFFLNVGCRPSLPESLGADKVKHLTSSSILDLDTLPAHLIVVGGSYIGLEFAQIYRRFGSKVTVIERGPRLIAHEDEEFSAAVQQLLEAEGITFRLNANCIHLQQIGEGVSVELDCDDEDLEVFGTHVLLAIGRTPNTDDLGLETIGAAVDEHGYIRVDDELKTSVEGVWAMGDCNGKGAFTHTAFNDFEIVAANVLTDERRKVSDRIPCHALYIDPPLAHVGMTEAEVRATGRPALVGVRPMTKVGRAVEKGETFGSMKVLVDAETRKILGATIFGVGGDEAIHSILAAMYAKQTADFMTHSMYIHPTVAELIPTVFGELKPLA